MPTHATFKKLLNLIDELDAKTESSLSKAAVTMMLYNAGVGKTSSSTASLISATYYDSNLATKHAFERFLDHERAAAQS